MVCDAQILAKLASGMHKPSQQTLVPMAAIPGLLQDLPIPKLRQLGGKFGDELMASLNIKTVGEALCELVCGTCCSQAPVVYREHRISICLAA